MRLKVRLAEPIIHGLIWLSGFLIMVTIMKTVGPFKRLDGTLLMPVTFGTVINLALFYVTSLGLIPHLSLRKKVMEFAGLLFLLLTVLTMIESLIDSAFFRYYYSDREESFISQFLLNLVMNSIIVSLGLGYGFAKNWIKNEKLRSRLVEEKLTAELNFMKAQLNPHFLFNVLNMAYSSATRSGDERTADIVEKLSGLMRYMLYDCNVDRIALEKEISYITNYIELQKMRFPEEMNVTVDFTVAGDYSHLMIAPLILIQFVENAFKYGVKFGKEAEIVISIELSDSNMIFRTKNRVFKMEGPEIKKSSGIGIPNARKRLKILYPEMHDLKILENGDTFKVDLLMNLGLHENEMYSY